MKKKRPGLGALFPNCLCMTALANRKLSPPAQNTQIKFQDAVSTEFDAEIALALTGTGWRTAALFLNLTAQYAKAGDCLSLDRNRRRAREQFLQEARAAEGASLLVEAFK
jgi:hypothetical protein